MTSPIRIALVGVGKIAHDQHLPTIAAVTDFELVATVDPHGDGVADRPAFHSLAELAASGLAVDAVAICTPPQVRRAIALSAIEQGWHVLLEKPPGATLAEAIAIRDAAAAAGVSLFASWHSRYAAGVEPARAWLSRRAARRGAIVWREDVRVWHPGQAWIWQPGGFGVFDPGINALSIATRIWPRPFFVEAAELDVPENVAAPIAARVAFQDTAGAPIDMDLDFRQEGPQSWDIVVETDAGALRLSQGGAVATVDGAPLAAHPTGAPGEYPALYARFAQLIRAGLSDVDVSPLRHVADAFLRGRHIPVDSFIE